MEIESLQTVQCLYKIDNTNQSKWNKEKYKGTQIWNQNTHILSKLPKTKTPLEKQSHFCRHRITEKHIPASLLKQWLITCEGNRETTQRAYGKFKIKKSSKSVLVIIKFHNQLQGNKYRNPTVIQYL